ncbi:hypothetical protein ABW19_dt0202693 [Dactylella cylindrospora]|nr:hypothetical protein ABW19_dt0202693 [Dactylella cylindrospora]
MATLSHLLSVYSREIKLLVILALSILILASYGVIIILFLRPSVFGLNSLIRPGQIALPYTTFTPAVFVALLSAILTGSTVTLVTRCVDDSLWRLLTPRDRKARLTIAETRNLAQWSISTAARCYYIFLGDSWALKFSGICIISFAVVNPILLSGISQTTLVSKKTTFQPRTSPYLWDGFLDNANTWYSSGTVRDLRGETAFLVSLNALNAPAATVCPDDLCSVNARMAGYQAECESSTINKLVYKPVSGGYSEATLCSSYSDEVCVRLIDGDPNIDASFTNLNASTARYGDFTTIFGAYKYNWASARTTITYLINCKVYYGWVNLTQTGQNPPEVVRSSFKIGKSDELVPFTNYLGRIYGDYDLRGQSSWNFTGGSYGANGEILVKYPVGLALLGWKSNYDGPTVARRIERAWDVNNLFAFARAVNTTDLSKTIETRTPIYIYNQKVLLVLLVPLVATILGVWGRWYVLGDDMMPGYDPVRIARWGPVSGVTEGVSDDTIDRLKVVRVPNPRRANGFEFIANGKGYDHRQVYGYT